mgnify:CR=1 FL=1
MIVILVTSSPTSQRAHEAVAYATEQLTQGHPVAVFFYADGVSVANRLRWLSAQVSDTAAQWQALHRQFGLALPVCVSAALARGIIDSDNATRHNLSGDTLLAPFYLTGLTDFLDLLESSAEANRTLVQF